MPASPETVGLIGARRASGDEAATPCSSTRPAGRSSTPRRSPRRCATGEIGAAGLDVYEAEPRRPGRAARGAALRACCRTSARRPRRARDAMARMAAENVLAVLGGSEPPNRVV